MIDIIKAAAVNFYVDPTGKVWLNVDGQCVARIGEATDVVLDLHTGPTYHLHHERGKRLLKRLELSEEEDEE